MPSVDKVIAAYIKLRDTKDEVKRKHSAELAPINDQMMKLEAFLQSELQKAGLTQFKAAGVGVAFIKTDTSATVEDRDAFFDFVKTNGKWELLDARCSKSVVQEYVEAHGEIPPGIKFQQEQVVQIRRG